MRDFQFHIRFGAIECLILSCVKEKKNERDKDRGKAQDENEELWSLAHVQVV